MVVVCGMQGEFSGQEDLCLCRNQRVLPNGAWIRDMDNDQIFGDNEKSRKRNGN